MSVHIVDDEQRRARPQAPCARRVAAARGHLRRCRASTMYQTSPPARRLPSGPAALATRLLYTFTTGSRCHG